MVIEIIFCKTEVMELPTQDKIKTLGVNET